MEIRLTAILLAFVAAGFSAAADDSPSQRFARERCAAARARKWRVRQKIQEVNKGVFLKY